MPTEATSMIHVHRLSVHGIASAISEDEDVRATSAVASRHISHHHGLHGDHRAHHHASHHRTSNTHALSRRWVVITVAVLLVRVRLLVDNRSDCGSRRRLLRGLRWRQRITVVVEHRRHERLVIRAHLAHHHTVLIVSRHTWLHLHLRVNRVSVHVISGSQRLDWGHGHLLRHIDDIAVHITHRLPKLVQLGLGWRHLLRWGKVDDVSVHVTHGLTELVQLGLRLRHGRLHRGRLLQHWLPLRAEHWLTVLVELLHGLSHHWLALRAQHRLTILVKLWHRLNHDWLALRTVHWLIVLIHLVDRLRSRLLLHRRLLKCLRLDHNRLAVLIEHRLTILIKLLHRLLWWHLLLLCRGLLRCLWRNHDWLTILIEHRLTILIKLLDRLLWGHLLLLI